MDIREGLNLKERADPDVLCILLVRIKQPGVNFLAFFLTGLYYFRNTGVRMEA